MVPAIVYVLIKTSDEWKFISNLRKDLQLTYALPETGKGGPQVHMTLYDHIQ